MTGGTYTLLVTVDRDVALAVGALGTVELAAGTYAYTGSAFGPGGFARVDRHRELAAGDRAGTHWHVDYLLDHDAATVAAVVTTPERDVECAVARRLPAGPDGFGASDCDCDGHLAADVARDAVERAHRTAVAALEDE
jgi:Uri superfamily endonuclease